MAAVPQPEVTTASIQAIAFGFYSDDEVRESRREGEGTGFSAPPPPPAAADGAGAPDGRRPRLPLCTAPVGPIRPLRSLPAERKNIWCMCRCKGREAVTGEAGARRAVKEEKKHARSAPAFLSLDNPPSLSRASPSLKVRRLSVKRITSPVARDNLGHPVPGGLYDPAMGPLAPGERCGTCGLGGAACAGHFGHVQLAVPVYNPLVFG